MEFVNKILIGLNKKRFEKDYTLKISDYIYKRLDDLGVPNEMTRTGNESLDASVRPKRVQSFYGDGKDVIVVSNHINAGGSKGRCATKYI